MVQRPLVPPLLQAAGVVESGCLGHWKREDVLQKALQPPEPHASEFLLIRIAISYSLAAACSLIRVSFFTCYHLEDRDVCANMQRASGEGCTPRRGKGSTELSDPLTVYSFVFLDGLLCSMPCARHWGNLVKMKWTLLMGSLGSTEKTVNDEITVK